MPTPKTVVVAVILATGGLGACGGSTRPPVSPSSPSLVHRSDHFVFQHGEADRGHIAATASALESRYAGILELLAVDRMPVVTVTLYTDHAAMAAAVAPVVGPIPEWAGGLVTAADRIHLMSPSVPGWIAANELVTHLAHELTHGVSLR